MGRSPALHGIGIDIVDVARFARIVGAYGRSFADRWFTDVERAQFGRDPVSPEALAQLFAMKEAAWKSMGPPDRAGAVPWRGIVVLRSSRSAWSVKLSGRAAEVAAAAGVDRVECAVSAEGGVAFAVAHSYREDHVSTGMTSATGEASLGAA